MTDSSSLSHPSLRSTLLLFSPSTSSLVLLLLLALSLSSLTSSQTLLYNRDMASIPSNFVFVSDSQVSPAPIYTASSLPPSQSQCDASTPVTFAIGLAQQNLDVLQQLFWNVSNPAHHMYRQYQTPAALWALIGPSTTVVSAIARWLVAGGVSQANVHFYGDVLEVYASCGAVNALFNTTMYVFLHPATEQTTVSQVGPSYIPDQFAPYIHMVIGIQTFPVPNQHNYVYGDRTSTLKDWAPAGEAGPSSTDGASTKDPHTPTHVMSLRSFQSMYHEDEEGAADFDENAAVSMRREGKHAFATMANAPNSAVVIPPSLQAAYGTPDRTLWTATNMASVPTTSVAVVEFLNTGPQSYNPTDLKNFGIFSGYAGAALTPAQDFEVSVKHVVGVNKKHKPGLEGTVDIQAVSGLNPAAQTWFWLMPSTTWIYSWAYQFYSQIEAGLPYPQVVSISYTSSDEYFNCGVPGSSDCEVYGINPADTGDSYSYESRTNTLFQMIGLAGVTILVSSGDDGANGIYGAPLVNGTASQQCAYVQQTLQFIPEWPTTSPYVTSVGATNFKNRAFGSPTYSNGPSSKAPFCGNGALLGADVASPFNFHCYSGNIHEQAVSIEYDGFTSGGGFSTIYAQPPYQTKAINAWLAGAPYMPAYPTGTTSYLFNINARAFPDVSAYGGAEWLVLFKSQVRYVAGTSLSTPVFASVVTLLNEVALTYGAKKPLGFLNPLLYAMQADTFNTSTPTFNDITVGDNKTPRDPAVNATCDGFLATAGWDPVSGLGTPNFPAMRQYLINLLTTGSGYSAGAQSSTGSLLPNQTGSGVSGPPTINPAIVGDPQFNGFAGQQFQVHGVPGAMYNIISAPAFQFNAEFAFLTEGVCSQELQQRTMCWTHPGNYLGSVAIMARDPDTGEEAVVLVRSGAHDEGLSVYVNDAALAVSPDQQRFGPLTVRHVDAFTALVTHASFLVQLDNSHFFLNQQVAMQPALNKAVQELKAAAAREKRTLTAAETAELPHGLLGQTWSEKRYANQWRHIQGHVADYQLSDGLLGHAFVYNRYRFDAAKEAARLEEIARLHASSLASRGVNRMRIGGQVDALLPAHAHDEEEESREWEDDLTNGKGLPIGEVPRTEDELLEEAEDDGRLSHGRPNGRPVSLAGSDSEPLQPLDASKMKPVPNKLALLPELAQQDLVWSSVHPETVEGLDGALPDAQGKGKGRGRMDHVKSAIDAATKRPRR